MKIQQLIEEQMKEFEKGFQMGETVVDHRWDAWKGGVLPSDIKTFIKAHDRKLIETLGEELINTKYKCERGLDEEGAEYDLCDFCSAIFSHKEEQRLKLKGILSNIK